MLLQCLCSHDILWSCSDVLLKSSHTEQSCSIANIKKSKHWCLSRNSGGISFVPKRCIHYNWEQLDYFATTCRHTSITNSPVCSPAGCQRRGVKARVVNNAITYLQIKLYTFKVSFLINLSGRFLITSGIFIPLLWIPQQLLHYSTILALFFHSTPCIKT
jgi:hypothetical protein